MAKVPYGKHLRRPCSRGDDNNNDVEAVSTANAPVEDFLPNANEARVESETATIWRQVPV
jgi:hypothetical protein